MHELNTYQTRPPALLRQRFKEQATRFFISILTNLTFEYLQFGDTNEDLIRLLMGFVTLDEESISQLVSDQDNINIFKKDGLDPSPAFRTFLLQLLIRYRYYVNIVNRNFVRKLLWHYRVEWTTGRWVMDHGSVTHDPWPICSFSVTVGFYLRDPQWNKKTINGGPQIQPYTWWKCIHLSISWVFAGLIYDIIILFIDQMYLERTYLCIWGKLWFATMTISCRKTCIYWLSNLLR